MLSPYDEDLSENKFFKEIKKNHKDILKKSAEENWIICVPRNGSFIDDNSSINVILDHILVKDNENIFSTLSKKELRLENHYLKVEQNSIFNNIVKVLFEETHYVEETNRYTVWCIERPLFLHQNHCDIPNNNVTLATIQDCIDFLYAEVFGSNVLENIQKLCLNFWNTHKDCFEILTLQCQKDFIGNLYSQCLQLFYKTDMIKEKCDKSEQFLQLIKVSIETYMQYCLGKRLMYSINTEQYFNDYILNKIIRNSIDISLTDLNISDGFSDLISNAKCELYRINNFVTALDKFNCLSRTFKIFNKHLSHGDKTMYVTSDDFLQILVYLILHSNIPNWVANLTYLKEYNFATLENPDQNSFLITSLEAAIEFIKSSQFLDITSSDKSQNNDTEKSKLFYIIYHKLKSDRDDFVLSEVAKKYISDFYKKVELCHPLCSCQKCEQLVKETPNPESLKILNKFNQNFLIIACIENDVNLLEYLFSLDFDVNFEDSFGKTALHYAAEKGFQDILLLLVNSKADVNVLDNERNTPLHLACDRGHENCAKALIYSSYVVEVNLQNHFGETPLFLATKWGYFDIIKILLENGASVCVKNNQKVSVYKLSPNYYVTNLFKEFGRGSNIILEEVIKDISISSSHSVPNTSEENCNSKTIIFKEQSLLYGYKPKNDLELKQIDLLIKTVENNDLPLTCFYLGYGSSSVETEKLRKKCHPLCMCTQCLKNEHFDSVDLFEQIKSELSTRESKFNVNTYNSDGFTPLHIAAKFGRTEILRILLDCGAYLNVRTLDTLYTPLHLAVTFQRVQTVKELLKCGDCNVDAKDYKGNSPLYYACVKNNLKLVEILLQNRADCQKRNYEDKSILQECEEKNLFRVCRMLRESIGYSSPKTTDTLSESTSSNVSFEANFGDIESDFEIL